jgi:hypothetical protein
MMYICITHIDADTGVLCTAEPMRTGPSFPAASGLEIKWADQSTWPIACNTDGSYINAPKYYGTCDDNVDTTVVGMLGVLTEVDWHAAKQIEIAARKPFASWVWNEADFDWEAPFPRPADAFINGGNIRYQWDEGIANWAAVGEVV